MIIRFALTFIIILIGLALFLTLRYGHIRRTNQRKITLPSGTHPTLLVFGSDSCAPCLTQEIYIDKLEPGLQDIITVEKIDVDSKREFADELGIFTLPTTVLIDKSGQVRHINYGLTTASKLERQLEKIDDSD